MRILLLGDSHLGVERRFWNPPPGWSRAQDHLAALRAALDPAFRDEVELVIHAGDLFDRSRPPPTAVAQAQGLLGALARRVPVVLLAGNHDRFGLGPTLGARDLPAGLHLVDAPGSLDLAGLRLGLVPHRAGVGRWAADARAACAGGVDLLVTHQAFAGSRVPGFTFQPGRPADTLGPDQLPPGVGLVLSGHVHTAQQLDLGPARVIHPGSTERSSFVEADEAKGAVLIEVVGGPPAWRARWRAHPVRPMRRVRDEDDLDRIEPGALVALPPAALRRLGPPAAARGGIVALPPAIPAPSRRQLPLFPRALPG